MECRAQRLFYRREELCGGRIHCAYFLLEESKCKISPMKHEAHPEAQVLQPWVAHKNNRIYDFNIFTGYRLTYNVFINCEVMLCFAGTAE